MRQPVDRIPETIIKRINFLLERRNLTVDQLAQRMGVTAGSLSQALSRRTIDGLLPKIAQALGVAERALTDEKVSAEELVRRSLIAHKAETRDFSGVTLGRIAHDGSERGFGRGKFALLDKDSSRPAPGDLVAYRSEDGAGWIVRRFGEPDGKRVYLVNPHLETKVESQSVQWAVGNLRRVLAICDVKAPEVLG